MKGNDYMTIVYLRLKKKIYVDINDKISLQDLAHISTDSSIMEKLQNTTIYTVRKEDEEIVVIDSFVIINYLNMLFERLEIQLVGPTETIVKVKQPQQNIPIIYVSFIWILLFIGTAMTIMNFHYDVSMQEVQQKLHLILTGKKEKFPLWIQIPYSFGLGIGMILYLNHWFKKRFNEEPSPLEVELYNYELNLDNYVRHYENELNDEKHDN